MKYKYILASNSPRRKELLAGLGLDFEVRVIDGIDESYPASLPAADVAQYIAEKKADAYRATLQPDEIIITADTVVIVGDDILGKPTDAADAARMLREISGRTHQVTTGVSLLTVSKQRSFSSPPTLPSSSSAMPRYSITSSTIAPSTRPAPTAFRSG